MWTSIEPEELRKIVQSKLIGEDGSNYAKVEDAIDKSLQVLFPDKQFDGKEGDIIYQTEKLIFEFLIMSSVESTLEVINLQNQKLAKQLDETKTEIDN